ncbi:hypothetical protein N657DRAFT_367308 [Parathielavia appendiculata]|uniref:Uncharacterized protein n=1 Tax=Parathielavia appendiculata TaxID=2587402 RepID=A0AAN6TQ79_9PEZI|nr:hypothetical protein N657DRAFT_367308 [Parathielavia appendiculata]
MVHESRTGVFSSIVTSCISILFLFFLFVPLSSFPFFFSFFHFSAFFSSSLALSPSVYRDLPFLYLRLYVHALFSLGL